LTWLHFKTQAEIVTLCSQSFVLDPEKTYELREPPNLRNERSPIRQTVDIMG
jgi:hypothetical protein